MSQHDVTSGGLWSPGTMRPLAVLALAGATALGVMIASPSISALLDKYRRALKRSRRRAQQGRPTPGEAGTLDAVPTEATEDVSSTWQPPDATNLPLLGVLYDIAEDLARRASYTHRGVLCSNCNLSPITGIRYKCSNCTDYDLCEHCEASDVHVRNHVFLKIRYPLPPFLSPRTPVLPLLYPGTGAGSQVKLKKESLLRLQQRTHFAGMEIEALFEEFKLIANMRGGENPHRAVIDREIFTQCLGPLGLEPNQITNYIFNFYDRDRDGVIDFTDLVCGLSILCRGTAEERIKLAFHGFDTDGDGYISREELRLLLLAHIQITNALMNDVIGTAFAQQLEALVLEDDKPVSSNFAMPIVSDLAVGIVTEDTEQGSRDGKDELAFAMLEASEDAIDKVTRRVFKDKTKLSFDEFRAVAMSDKTLTLWIDTIGSIF